MSTLSAAQRRGAAKKPDAYRIVGTACRAAILRPSCSAAFLHDF